MLAKMFSRHYRISMKRTITLIMATGVIGLAGACGDAVSGIENSAVKETVAANGVREVVEDGELKALNTGIVTCREWGEIVWIVPEGTVVKPGDRLLELNTRETSERIEELEARIRQIETRLEELNRDVIDARKRLDDECRNIRGRTELTAVQLKELEAGATRLEKREATADLERARIGYTAALDDLEREKVLYARGIGSETGINEKTFLMKQARLDLKKQELNYQMKYAPATPFELQGAQIDLSLARAQEALVCERAAQEVRNRESEIEENVYSLERHRQRLEREREKLKALTLHANRDGVVIHMRRHNHNQKIKVGDWVYQGFGPVAIEDFRNLKIETKISERFVRTITPGDTVSFSVLPIPDEGFTGEVLSVEDWAYDRNYDLSEEEQTKFGLSGENVFRVNIRILGEDERLKPGFKAKVKFFPAQRPE